MDEEHSDTYKSDMSPRYHARETAIFRASQFGAAVVLASATPSVESYYKAQTGEYKLLEMNTRYNKNKMPEISVIDMRSELAVNRQFCFLTGVDFLHLFRVAVADMYRIVRIATYRLHIINLRIN